MSRPDLRPVRDGGAHMFDHISIGVRDIARSKSFYDSALQAIGYKRLSEGDIDQSWRLSRLKDGRNRVGTGRRQAAPGKRRRSSGFEVGYGGGVDRDELRVHAADLDRAAA